MVETRDELENSVWMRVDGVSLLRCLESFPEVADRVVDRINPFSIIWRLCTAVLGFPVSILQVIRASILALYCLLFHSLYKANPGTTTIVPLPFPWFSFSILVFCNSKPLAWTTGNNLRISSQPIGLYSDLFSILKSCRSSCPTNNLLLSGCIYRGYQIRHVDIRTEG